MYVGLDLGEKDMFKGDKRKEKVMRSAKVVYTKAFTAKLARFLAAPTCTVQDVKQLEAVNHALVTVHWCEPGEGDPATQRPSPVGRGRARVSDRRVRSGEQFRHVTKRASHELHSE